MPCKNNGEDKRAVIARINENLTLFYCLQIYVVYRCGNTKIAWIFIGGKKLQRETASVYTNVVIAKNYRKPKKLHFFISRSSYNRHHIRIFHS